MAQLDLLELLPGQPLIGIAQAHTEALLNQALYARGIEVERGLSLQTLQQDADGVTLLLQHAEGGQESVTASIVFGADGARSTVRHQLGLAFDGSLFPEPWKLWDVQLQTSLDPQCAYIVFLPDGFMFMMALQGDVWRVLGNSVDPLRQLPAGSVPGRLYWQSEFHIAHRLASQVCVGRVALGGDAAHLHSPLGARGMNLGIEDAWVFADCAADAIDGRLQRLREYGELREVVHHRVVKKIAMMTRLMRGKPAALGRLREWIVPQLVKLPPVRQQMAATVAGMDHPLRTRL